MASSILGRMGQLLRADVNAILDSAADPQKMLDQLIRDYSSNISEAETAVAQTIGNLRLTEEDQQEASQAVTEWGQKAQAASKKADQLRAGGQTSDADRFDDLAKFALRKQIGYEEQAKSLATQVSQQQQLTDQLKDGLNKLRAKRDDLVQRRDQLVSRAKMAGAQVRVQTALKSVSALDPTSELSRFEDQVRHQEALAQGMAEVSASSPEEQFAQLAADADEQEVEDRFKQLKSGQPPQLAAGS